jgi:hypothetical protein
LLVWVAFILCLENINVAQGFRSRTINVIIVVLTLYVFTVKLYAVPVVILCLYLFYLQSKVKMWAEVWLQIGLGLIVVIPWIARNIILSGYLIYPFPYIDLFNVDWKLLYQYVIDEKLSTHGWAYLPGSHWRELLDMPLSEWIPKWLDQVHYPYRITVIATFLIMSVYIPIAVLRSSRQTGWTNTREILYLIGCIGVIYWFTNAPDPRYGWGFIFIAFIIPVAPLIEHIVIRFKASSRLCMLSIMILHILNHGYLSIHSLPKNVSIIFSTIPYQTEELKAKLVGDIVIYSPIKTDQCRYIPLPCTPVVKDWLRPRGDKLQSGFRAAQAKAVR